MAGADSSDACVPKVLTDFIFDLFDSVTLSQIREEQLKLYRTDFYNLHHAYFSNSPWPSPESIASECNGNPLFLALYRELTDRQFHANDRPSLRDRIDGWQVYQQLFDEILEDHTNVYIVPQWCFDILHEFVYQFQGYCQVRAAVYASMARASNSSAADGQQQQPNATLVDNYRLLQNTDAWDVQAVFAYLHRFQQLGADHPDKPFCAYLTLFSSIALSRLECLLGDYTQCLQALTPVAARSDVAIPVTRTTSTTHLEVLHSVTPARLSMAYHAGVAFLMLRRYKDAVHVLNDMCVVLQRAIKTGQLRKVYDHHHSSSSNSGQTGALQQQQQQNATTLKQYDRMMNLLAILTQILPGSNLLDDAVSKAIREKFGKTLENNKYEDCFACPKFISVASYPTSFHRQQVVLFVKEMKRQPSFQTLRSYLKLYTSLPLSKLAHFHDMSEAQFLPLLLGYKAFMRQLEKTDSSHIDGTYKTALDIHYYLALDVCFVDEAEKQRRFENYFFGRIAQTHEIQKEAVAIDTKV